MLKKRIISLFLVGFAVIILACVIVHSIQQEKATEFIKASEIELNKKEQEMFTTLFGITPPKYLSILECAKKETDSETCFAVKAAVSRTEANSLINSLKKHTGIELYEYEWIRTPVWDDFGGTFSWWNIHEGKHIASYALYLDSHDPSGASAITIVRSGGVYYVYMWYANPAQIAK